MKSNQISKEKRQELKKIYDSLNPAQLNPVRYLSSNGVKRTIEQKLDNLYKVYKQKQRSASEVESFKRLTPRLVTKYIVQQEPLRLPT